MDISERPGCINIQKSEIKPAALNNDILTGDIGELLKILMLSEGDTFT
jgi:hypothetical protein